MSMITNRIIPKTGTTLASIAFLLTACLMISACYGQVTSATNKIKPPKKIEKSEKPEKNKPRLLKSEHLTVDLTNRKITIATVLCLPKGHSTLEFLLCGSPVQKAHESLLSTKATGKSMHLALLLLGLSQGIPAKYTYLDVNKEYFTPPRGAEVKITLRWKDKKGITHLASPDQWMTKREGAKIPPPKKFVFVGSDTSLDGKYWADSQGELISLCNRRSAVLDIPFQGTDKKGMETFLANTKALPPHNTTVEMIIEPIAGTEKSSYARALINIDHLGNITVDGLSVDADKLQQWADKFTQKHNDALVVVRPTPRTTVGDVQWVLDTLKLGGVFDTEVHRSTRIVEIPRSAKAKKRILNEWVKKFADPENQIEEPASEAQWFINLLQKRQSELKTNQWLMQECINDLKQMRASYLKNKLKPLPEPAKQ